MHFLVDATNTIRLLNLVLILWQAMMLTCLADNQVRPADRKGCMLTSPMTVTVWHDAETAHR